jgi:hypothetical protein
MLTSKMATATAAASAVSNPASSAGRSPTPVLRWGVMGCANIAQKNIRAILLSSEHNTLAAIATRSEAKGRTFMETNQLSASDVKLYLSYEEFLADSSIDAIYVPLPTTLHKVWVPRIAAAGKHVLCEKPVAENAADLQALLDACNEHNVIFMDGVMFMHHERVMLLRKSLSDPLFGVSHRKEICRITASLVLFGVQEVRKVSSNFYFHAPPEFFTDNIRASASADPLGALGDLGLSSQEYSSGLQNKHKYC